MLFRLAPDNPNFNFLSLRFVCAGISAFLFAGTFFLLLTWGLNYGIDFSGGTLIQFKTEKQINIAQIRTALESQNIAGATIQQYGAADEFLVRLPVEAASGQSTEKTRVEGLQTSLAPQAGAIEIRRVEYVGPQIGGELAQKGMIAGILSLIAVVIYIWARFELRFAVGAFVALLHDVVLTIGVFSLTQKEISLTVLAAILTLIGYSLNDTIVVYDRIRENLQRYRKKPLIEVLNLSVNEMLNRTLIMTACVLVVLFSLLWLGGDTLHDFSFALVFGVLVGTYSSVFVAAPTVLWMDAWTQRNKQQEAPEKK